MRCGQVGAGPGIGQAAAQLVGELSAGEPADPFQRTDRALAGADGQREQLGDGGELGEHPALAADGPGRQEVVGARDAEPETDGGEEDDGRHGTPAHHGQHRARRSTEDAGDLFERIAMTSPAKAARQILTAVEKDKRRALIGPDAKVFDLVSRLPAGLYQRAIVRGSKLQR